MILILVTNAVYNVPNNIIRRYDYDINTEYIKNCDLGDGKILQNIKHKF